ncbi:MAG: family 43 glycosylhydrolase [Oscillospiraceae bacterium]|nr:family 43 glycosylhydrolase [Oscillospiraceae bacterium]
MQLADNLRQGVNPYLPSWEYVPDGEPYVFGDRVYVYGSHDHFGGYEYCQNDYVCWSAPVSNLGNWRYEGVIYPRDADPLNPDGDMLLFAPDVTCGPDGRYYLYYVLDKVGVVSVAVSAVPAGPFEFYGHVHYPDGSLLGTTADDEPQFDPGVLFEHGRLYLYTGFCMPENRQRHGAMVTVLEADMLTVAIKPAFVAPSAPYAVGTGFEGHAFFEASSIRKISGQYYFIYSSILSHELCYAVSASPLGPFKYRGTLVSNCDLFIDSYKPAGRPMYYGGNNHGSLVQINGDWYVFYHRHTNGCNFSRQGCIEKVRILPDGSIPQVSMTSCGPQAVPLRGEGLYPAYIACSLYCATEAMTVGAPGDWMDCRFPRITQDQPDGQEGLSYIANLRAGAVAGFRFFDCQGIHELTVYTRGGGGQLLVKTAWDAAPCGRVAVGGNNEWRAFTAEIQLPDGIQSLYFEYQGGGNLALAAFSLGRG